MKLFVTLTVIFHQYIVYCRPYSCHAADLRLELQVLMSQHSGSLEYLIEMLTRHGYSTSTTFDIRTVFSAPTNYGTQVHNLISSLKTIHDVTYRLKDLSSSWDEFYYHHVHFLTNVNTKQIYRCTDNQEIRRNPYIDSMDQQDLLGSLLSSFMTMFIAETFLMEQLL